MIKRLKIFLMFCVICQNFCIAQTIEPESLFGKWKIRDWLFFEKFSETKQEHKVRLKEFSECLKNKVIIDSEGIKIQGNNKCNFSPCNYAFSKHPQYLEKKIIQDNDFTRKEQGSEMIDSNIVGRKFVDYLDKKYTKPTLLLLDAGCTQSYGDFTMKICIVSKNKIGLFMGEELMILERIPCKK